MKTTLLVLLFGFVACSLAAKGMNGNGTAEGGDDSRDRSGNGGSGMRFDKEKLMKKAMNFKRQMARFADHFNPDGGKCMVEKQGRELKEYQKMFKKVAKILEGLKKSCMKFERKRLMRGDKTPCKHFTELEFEELPNNQLDVSVRYNASTKDCGPARTWFALRNATSGDKATDPSFLLRRCAAAPNCSEEWDGNLNVDRPLNGSGNYTFTRNHRPGPCASEDGNQVEMEVRECDDGAFRVFRMRNNDECMNGDVCSVDNSEKKKQMEDMMDDMMDDDDDDD